MERLFSAYLALVFSNSSFEFLKHAPARPRAKESVVWKEHIPEKVHAAMTWLKDDLVLMQRKSQARIEKGFDTCSEVRNGIGYDNEVVGVARILLYLQLMLHELIKLVQVDIGEDLTCQISNWHPFPRRRRNSLSLSLSLVIGTT